MPPVVGRSTKTKPWTEVDVRRVAAGSAKRLRIIQVTDLHLFHTTPEDDELTFKDIARYLELFKPDLLVATGDLWHDNDHGVGARGLEQITRRFSDFGVPWTTEWGNHDLLDDYQAGHDAFFESRHSVYNGAHTHGDYRVEVTAPGSDSHPVLDLYFLNSNKEGLGPWQAGALRTMVQQVATRDSTPPPAILFHHIPMAELKTRLDAQTFRGLKLEDVSSGQDNGVTFPVVQQSGSIRACFCGHNHVNDYALTIGGITLNYGRSTGKAGYGGERLRKGAKLIDVDLGHGTLEVASVFPDGSRLA